MKHDLYIQILQFLRDNLHRHISDEQEVFNYLRDEKGVDISKLDIKAKIHNVFAKATGNARNSGGNRYIMKLDAYFNLLQYEELQEARKSSQDAQKQAMTSNRIAIAALVVTCVSLVASIILSVWALNSPTTIENRQVDRIVDGIKNKKLTKIGHGKVK